MATLTGNQDTATIRATQGQGQEAEHTACDDDLRCAGSNEFNLEYEVDIF